MKECFQTWRGSNPRPPDHQSDAHPTEPPRPACDVMVIVPKRGVKKQEGQLRRCKVSNWTTRIRGLILFFAGRTDILQDVGTLSHVAAQLRPRNT